MTTWVKADEKAHIANERRFLEMLQDTPFVPRLFGYTESEVEMEYLAPQDVTDEDQWIRNCAEALRVLRARGICHGDLTEYNVKVKNNVPVFIDWAESKLAREPGPDKRPEGDAYHLWRTALHYITDNRRVLRRWIAIREHLKGESLLDLGAAHGLFVACALGEGLRAIGVDREAEPANDMVRADIGKTMVTLKGDNILLLDVWPYLAQDYGWDASEDILAHLMDSCRVLFFESQLYGDGPGPTAFRTREDVSTFLARHGAVTPLVDIRLEDRDAVRTTFAVKRE